MMITALRTAFVVAAAPSPADTTRFAQGIDYRIEARLDELTDVLTGRAELRYTNHSTATLDTLWFHQHLNAFRPNSAWARREMALGNTRFQVLGAEQHAFERLSSVEVGGRAVRPHYPGAPDSTVVGIPMPAGIQPGETVVVQFDWTARLSTTPRRQGREGRHYDWAHWYPRIAVFGPLGWEVQSLLPQGEFFGEFGSYDVVLEVAEDQVVGATGVPVSGDPGYPAEGAPLNRDFYAPRPEPRLGLLGPSPGSGQKQLRWRAEDVHHFAWSASPDFLYEGATVERTGADGVPISIHVLFKPEDTDWANGVALGRTVRALDWLQGMFGPYVWPQLTNLHRIEPGGTEFPMMMMNGSPSEGLIVHEATHQYLHGMLANNEFTEAWLDEGFTSFITNWYHEERGVTDVWDSTLDALREWERAGRTESVGLAAADFSEFNVYSAMSYAKAEIVLRMLRWMIGEQTMRDAIQLFYDRHLLQHVREEDFRRAVSDAAGEDLDWFFQQWIHTTDRLDYAITGATARQRADGSWVSRVEITRSGDAWMPVTLQVGDSSQRLESRERHQVVEVVTRARPAEAVLDPENVLLDYDVRNNRRTVSVGS
jgi:hypothetical protein